MLCLLVDVLAVFFGALRGGERVRGGGGERGRERERERERERGGGLRVREMVKGPPDLWLFEVPRAGPYLCPGCDCVEIWK